MHLFFFFSLFLDTFFFLFINNFLFVLFILVIEMEVLENVFKIVSFPVKRSLFLSAILITWDVFYLVNVVACLKLNMN